MIEVQVADPLVVLHHRHTRMLGHEPNESFAAARDREVDGAGLDESANGVAILRREECHGVLGKPARAERLHESLANREIGSERLRAAPQHDGVARLQRQRRDLRRHVGARLVDHRDESKGHAGARDAKPVRADGRLDDVTDGVPEVGDLERSTRHRVDTRVVEAEPVEHRLGGALCVRVLVVGAVGVEKGRAVVTEARCDRAEDRVLRRSLLPREERERRARAVAREGDLRIEGRGGYEQGPRSSRSAGKWPVAGT